MARLRVEIDVPEWTVEALQKAVHDLDALEDDIPIDVDKVKASDVLTLMYTANLGLSEVYLVNEMED